MKSILVDRLVDMMMMNIVINTDGWYKLSVSVRSHSWFMAFTAGLLVKLLSLLI